ncbi:Endonuclease/exonuclease/phosphatase [Penicillium argentinense]|uniref:Endonuclease/exonuclease/phosphatase n=1 Tax=Penicillium argentinense TaxID=1131581 RepID=A0A9W9EWH5_9EURO|nr:Endonuclease/exonuclease/phosphatase [Penicillium argentinense]KAJ5089155.1 Endonuclease/exonuclease/phosphatase [Penicillium argentinense]
MEDLNLYILTANCARNLIDIDRFAEHFFNALPTSTGSFSAPELIVLSLQEIAPIAYSFLGGSYLIPYYDAFIQAVQKAATKQFGRSYESVLQDHIGMTGLMVFARSDVTDRISWIETAYVGFGVQEMGNKGAVGARLGYVVDEHSAQTMNLTFVAAHLAPMENALEQRNLDWQSIVERLVFSQQDTASKSGDSEGADENATLLGSHRSSESQPETRRDLFAPNSYLFLAGDLNYRTSDIQPSKADVLRFPRRLVNRESTLHYSHLLKEDQLMRQMQQGKSFHGLSEAPIDFPPTYKYSDAAREAARLGVDSGDAEWKWSSHRWPSWCDRILYLDAPEGGERRVKPQAYDALPLLPQSDHRPVALAISVPVPLKRTSSRADHTDESRVAPFAIDPRWRSRREVARRKEVVVGVLAYLGLTWEGNGLLLASTIGILGTWMVLRSLWGA